MAVCPKALLVRWIGRDLAYPEVVQPIQLLSNQFPGLVQVPMAQVFQVRQAAPVLPNESTSTPSTIARRFSAITWRRLLGAVYNFAASIFRARRFGLPGWLPFSFMPCNLRQNSALIIVGQVGARLGA